MIVKTGLVQISKLVDPEKDNIQVQMLTNSKEKNNKTAGIIDQIKSKTVQFDSQEDDNQESVLKEY